MNSMEKNLWVNNSRIARQKPFYIFSYHLYRPPVFIGMRITNTSSLLRNKKKRGQTLVEYALILAFISVVAISTLMRLGEEIKSVFTTITSQLAVASSSH